MTIHLPPYIVSLGLASSVGSMSLSLIGFSNIVGTIVSGYIGGIWRPRIPLASIYLLRSIALVIFITLPASVLSVGVFSIVFGLLWLSTIPLTIGIIARIYGTQFIGTLYGIVFFSHQLGSFAGLLIAGWSLEITGNYTLIWWISIVLGVLAFLVHLPIDDTKRDLSIQSANA